MSTWETPGVRQSEAWRACQGKTQRTFRGAKSAGRLDVDRASGLTRLLRYGVASHVGWEDYMEQSGLRRQ
jgi:hypothetical protein